MHLLVLFYIFLGFIDIVSHGLVVLNCSEEGLIHAGDIWLWRVWVLDKAIARWVSQLKVKWEIAALTKRFQLLEEFVDLCGNLRIILATLVLHLRDSFNRSEEITLHGLDGSLLSLCWNLKVKLWDSD